MIQKYKNHIIIVFVLIFFLIPLKKVFPLDYLYTIDPRQHMYVSEHIEIDDYYADSIPVADGVYEIHYPSMMRSYLMLFHELTGVADIDVYKYFGFVMRVVLAILLLLIARVITKKESLYFDLIFVLLIFGSFYFRHRSWITFTENFALVYHMLVFLYGYKFVRHGNTKGFGFAVCGVVAAMWFHRPSFIISGVIIGLVTVLGAMRWRNYASMGYIAVGGLVLSYPVLSGLLSEYMRQLKENVGNTEGYGDLSRFTPPGLLDYIEFASPLIIVFAVIGVYVCYRMRKTQESRYEILLLLGCAGFAFLLSQTTRVGLNLPMDRMQGFFMPFVLLLACMGAYFRLSQATRVTKVMLFLLLFSVSFHTMLSSNPWFKLYKGEIATKEFLLETYEEDRNYYFTGGTNMFELQFPYHENVLVSYDRLQAGDYIITYDELPLSSVYASGSISVYRY